ncbi:hypothetical protein ACF1BN_34305 [Streptomyces sp. NPDC014861]|uniref:hypothetical protein n=1 Tax=Streptomyces sp. NPDC014861 TaxID=3364923 RepID=UPI0037028D72
MRPLASRRLTALAISAALTLTLGMAGSAVADELPPSLAADRAARAPLPDAAALLAQAEALGDVGGVTTPVAELVTAALEADDGQVPAADAEALKAKIQAAVDQAKETAPAPLPETPAAPEAPVSPPTDDAPVAPPAVEAPGGLPVAPPVALPVAAGAKAAQAAPADLVDDALASVEEAVAGLVAVITSGGAAGVVPQVTAALTSLVNLAVATVLGSGLPAPDLAGLPALPALPVEAPELPAVPPAEVPELPADVPAAPPVAAPELPAPLPLPVG